MYCLCLFVWKPVIHFVTIVCIALFMRKLLNPVLMLLNRLNLRFAVICSCSFYFSVTLGEDGVVVVVMVRWTKTRCQSPQMLARRKFQKMLNKALLTLLLIRKMNQRNTTFIQNTLSKRTAGHFAQRTKNITHIKT